MNFNLSDPYIVDLLLEQIEKLIDKKINKLNFDKEISAVIANTPTTEGFADVILNGVVGDLTGKTVIPNVMVKPGVRVKQNQEVYVKAINGNFNNLLVDTNKNTNSIELNLGYKSVSSSTSLQIYDCIIYANCTAGNINLTLPDASKCSGKVIIFKRTDSSSNSITILPYGTQKIDGVSSLSLTTNYPKQWLHSDGSNWWILMG